jgi:hypothetical protein
MAVVRFGNAGPYLGLIDEGTAGYVQEFNIKVVFDEVEVPNNIGEVVTYGMFNKRYEGQVVLIDKSGGTRPAVAATFAFANLSVGLYGDPASVIVTDHDRKPEQKGAQRHTYNFKAYINI